jgi:hypothetical protein
MLYHFISIGDEPDKEEDKMDGEKSDNKKFEKIQSISNPSSHHDILR